MCNGHRYHPRHSYTVNHHQCITTCQPCPGCVIEVNETGTKLSYKPGILTGGKVTHDCGARAVGWFIEGVLPLLLFCKSPSHLTLTGITNDDQDLSVDCIQHATAPLLRHFGVEGSYLHTLYS
jgi:RNA 3'-terminal phosphate cyclase-like protein